VRVLPVELTVSKWKQSTDQLSVQCGVHGSRRRRVLTVCGGEVQRCSWLCLMHRLRRRQVHYNYWSKVLCGLRRRHVFHDYGCFSGHRVHVLPAERTVSKWKQAEDQLSVQYGVHGSRRRRVLTVCSGEVQGCYWLCLMHQLRRWYIQGCGAGTYSATLAASAVGSCLGCPENSHSPPGSTAIGACVLFPRWSTSEYIGSGRGVRKFLECSTFLEWVLVLLAAPIANTLIVSLSA
jgi:hypothetical protein